MRKLFQTVWKLSKKLQDYLELSSLTTQKLSRLSGNFPYVWKLSRLSGKFPDCPENFQTVRKLFRLSKSFPDCKETFQTVLKLSRLSQNFPDCPETFQTVQKLYILSGIFPDLCYVLTFFGANFVDTCKNFPDAQKLSGRQCRHADGVFLPLGPSRPHLLVGPFGGNII